jgi:hypothetical protein
MLFNSKSVAPGMPSHPRVCCILPTLSISRLLLRRRSPFHLIVTFGSTLKIPHSAGGSNGHEFSPH